MTIAPAGGLSPAYNTIFKGVILLITVWGFVVLNDNGIDIEEQDKPYAFHYFDDNGGEPEGNYTDKDIKGKWLLIDGKVDIKKDNVIYAYRDIDNTTMIKVD